MGADLLRSKWVIACVVLLTALCVLPLSRLRFDNTPESWLPADSPARHRLDEFHKQFGDGMLVLVYARGEGLQNQTEAWKQLLTQLRAQPGVQKVYPPPFIEEPNEDGPRPPIIGYLASEDGRHAAALVVPKEGLPLSERSQLVEQLEQLVRNSPQSIRPLELAGAPVITHDLDRGSRTSLEQLGPIVAIAMCLVLYFTMQDWRIVLAALAVIATSTAWTMALMSLFGRPLNLVVVTMPAILSVVTVTQAMHTMTRFFHQSSSLSRAEAWTRGLKEILPPSLSCTATTAAGFASLATSSILPVRDLGIFTALGVAICFILSFTLFPTLLEFSSRIRPRSAPDVSGWWEVSRATRYCNWLRRSRWKIVAVTGLGVVFGLVGLTQIRVESHILEFFPKSHRIPVNYFSIEKNLIGLTPIDLVFSGPRDVLLSDHALESYRKFLEKTVAEEPMARQVVSVLLEPTRGKKLEFVMTPAELREAVGGEDLPAELASFVHFDKDRITLRTMVMCETRSSNATYEMMERLNARLKTENIGPQVEAEIAGPTPLLIEGQVLLLRTQIESFGVALAVVAIVLMVAFRDWRKALMGIAPNLIPILITLGLMGWLGIPLNTATVTVAGIALGIIVDDTIHFLHQFSVARKNGNAPPEAVERALLGMAKPAAVSSGAVAMGFALFGLSPFLPTAYLGVLIAITALTALYCDLVFMPALMSGRNLATRKDA